MRQCTAFVLVLALISMFPRAPLAHAATALAKVRVIQHGLTVQAPHKKRAKGKVKQALYTRYRLQTKAQQRASIGFDDGTLLHINQRTDVTLRDPHVTVVSKGAVNQIDLPGSKHVVQTAAAVATATGTNFEVEVQRGKTTVIVVLGTVELSNKKGSVTLHRNQESVARQNQPPGPATPVDADAAVGWTTPLAGWQVLKPTFPSPFGVTTDPQGNIYVTNLDAHVVKLSPGGKILRTWGSKGSGPGQFGNPTGIAADSSGHVYVADALHGVIQKFTTDGQYLATFGTTDVPGSNPGEFFSPDGLAVDRAGNVYVADQGNSRVQKLSPDGAPLAVFRAGDPVAGIGETYGVAVDSAGNIYATDTTTNQVVKFSQSDQELARFGTKGTEPGQFDGPSGVAVDAAGNIFVADSLNMRVQELAPDGSPIAVWSHPGVLENQGPANPGLFFEPSGVFVDSHGTVYVADTGNNRVQRLVR